MPRTMLAIAAIALIACTYAAPMEESWHAEDELLVRVFSDSAPMAVLMQDAPAAPDAAAHEGRIAAAAGAASSNADVAAGAKKTEDEQAAAQAGFDTKAAELKTKQEALTAKASADNIAAAKKASDDAEDAASKVMAAMAASTKAEADNKEMQAKYAKQIADLKAADEAGKEEAKARVDETAAGIKANNDAIAAENAKMEAASKAKADAEAAHKTALDGISDKYNADSKAIKDKLAADSKTLSDEKAASDAKFAAEFKGNAAKAAAAKAAIAAEVIANKKQDEGEKAAIKAKFDAIEGSAEAAHKSWQNEADAKAASLAADREDTKKATEKVAKAAEADYQSKMGVVAKETADAEAANEASDANMEKDEKDQAQTEKDFAANMAEDSEIASCATDGSECQSADGKCHKITDTGPFMGDNLVSCVATKPAEQAYAGEAWVHLAPPAAMVLRPAPSTECTEAKTAFATKCGVSYSDESLPLTSLACEDGACSTVEDLTAFFHMASICPAWCEPGTATYTQPPPGSASMEPVKDTDGNCITSADFGQFENILKDTPIYTNTGTGERFPAGKSTSACTYVENFLKGFNVGAHGETSLIQAAPDAAAHKGRIAAAEGAASTNAAAAVAAKSDEDSQAAKQAGFDATAKELGEKQEALTAKASADNLAAAKQAEIDAADTVKKSIAAAADSIKHTADNKIMQAQYAKQVAELKAADEAGKVEAKARVDETAAGIKANNDAIAVQEAKVAAAKKAKADAEAALKTTQDGIQAKYDADSKAIKDKLAADSKALADESSVAQAKFAAKFKSNAEKAAAQQAALKAEVKSNAATDAADKQAIKDKYAAKAASAEAAHKSWQAEADAKAAALSAAREGDKKATEATAKAAEADYQSKMSEAATKSTAADNAVQAYTTQMEKDKKTQATIDAQSKAAMDEDAEIKSCDMDGSECLALDGSCSKTGPDGPFMASDLTTCTDTKPAEQAYAGEAWVGLAPPLPRTLIAAPSEACIAAKKAFKTDCGIDIDTSEDCPLKALGCGSGPCSGSVVKLTAFFEMASICPKWCVPGSATHTADGVQDSDGDCITPADFAQMKLALEDTPIYKDTGTGGRFPAGSSTSACTYATEFVSGFVAGTKAKN